MKNINFKAVAVGVLVDILGAFLCVALFMILMSVRLYGNGIPGEAALTQNTQELMHNTNFLAGIFVIGTCFDFIAGLIAGKIAKTSEVTHACLVGTISLLISLALDLSDSTPSTFPAWFNWTSSLITIPTVISGGVFSKKFKESHFLSTNLRRKFSVLDCVIVFCFYKAAQLIGWSYFARIDIISSMIEALLWTITALGLIKKINICRIALIAWLGIELILGVPYQLSHLSKIDLPAVASIAFYIFIRAYVIYYLRRKPICLIFKANGSNGVSERLDNFEDAPDENSVR